MALGSISFQDFLPKGIRCHPVFSLAFSGESKFFFANVVECIQTARHIYERSTHRAVRGALTLICDVRFNSALRIALLAKGELFKFLTSKLMGFGRNDNTIRQIHHMKIMVKRHHWRSSVCMRNMLFCKGQRSYAQGQFIRAIQFFGQAILMGHERAHAILANLLLGGRDGLPKDVEKAFKIASLGEKNGYTCCTGVLARCFLMGLGCNTNTSFGFILAKRSSETGCFFGDYAMGLCNFYGLEIPKNVVVAMRHFEIAAARSHVESLIFVGYMYENGIGGFRDYDEALRYYTQAAEQGCVVAQKNIGCLTMLISRMHDRGDRSDGD
jgi:hypothetical protein